MVTLVEKILATHAFFPFKGTTVHLSLELLMPNEFMSVALRFMIKDENTEVRSILMYDVRVGEAILEAIKKIESIAEEYTTAPILNEGK